jgi:ubiquitin C-terminal hydrolase
MTHPLNNPFDISGLNNLGNSCYFNSSLQLLKPIFDTLLSKIGFNSYNNQLKNEIREYYNTYTDKDKLKTKYEYICNKLNSNGEQRDCHESLSILLNDIVDKLSENDKSIFSIRVKYNNLIRCSNCSQFKICNNGVEEFDNYLISYCFTNNKINNNPIPFDKFLGSVLQRECINENLMKTFRQENKKCTCDISNLGMQTVLTNMPTFLIIYVNRCNHIDQSKLFNRLLISENFSITTPESLENRCRNGKKKDVIHTYNLYGIVNHDGGSMNGGHYYTYIKSVSNQKWYLCNDNNISKIKHFDSNDIKIQQNCVILLYIKN